MNNFVHMNLLYALFGIGMALTVALGAVAIAGRSLIPNRTEVVPMSVRDNPGSWRPTYGGYTPYNPSSGGSSGGYSGGK